ncbi:MAG: hypothetical protein NT001_01820 [Candidatus Woesearchaeota archaeon]|nr:hypothetical protein [Candidatus Woesearchaeota archaeon]
MERKKGKRQLFLSFLVLFSALIGLISAEPAMSIGISSLSVLPAYLIATPYLTASYDFTANGYGSDTEPYVDGDLSKYMALSKPEIMGPYQKKFTATLSLPGDFNESAGMHHIMIGAREIVPPSAGGISVMTRVQSPLNVFVLYEGKYIDATLTTQNVNVNEIDDIKVTVVNLGKQFINMLKVKVDIYNASSVKIKELQESELGLESGKEKDFDFELNTTGMLAGDYTATATIDYDESLKDLSRKFIIGQMRVKVIDYTKRLYSGMINKFDIKAANEWNGIISSAYAEVNIYTPQKNLTSRTATENINPLGEAQFTGYIDANGTVPGDYPVKIDLFYEEDKSVERGTVSIVKPSEMFLPGNLWFIAGLAIGIILIILTFINVVLLLKRGKNDKAQEPPKI